MSTFWLQQALHILQVASFYLPLAIAFALIQGITRRVFLAFGDLAMFASFAAVYSAIGAMVNGLDDGATALISLALAIGCGAALGAVIARVVMGRRLLAVPLGFMIASIGISIIIREVMRLKSHSHDVWVPPLYEKQMLLEGVVNLPVMSAWAIGLGVAAALASWAILSGTSFGMKWRACAQAPELAALCGVDALLVASQTFALAGGLSALTGWTSAMTYGGASFSSGTIIGFKAMFASVVGGFGTLRGAMLGTAAFAGVEVLWSAVFGTTYRDVAIFAIIIASLYLKPEGLAGEPET